MSISTLHTCTKSSRRLFWIVVAAVTASSAQAFSGPEHRDLSNAALSLAIRHFQDTKREACLPNPDPCATITTLGKSLLTDPKEHTFGDLTTAVDWFQGPEILTYEIAWNHVDQRRRLRGAILHGLALHRNKAHFQVEALNSYARFHDQAIVFARHHDSHRALYSEAVALHFLQDFFAAGHFVTPRAGFQDAVAGSLHDKYNIEGVNVSLQIPSVGPWKKLVAELQDGAPFQGKQLRIDADDVKRFSAADGIGFRAGGDDCLIQIPEQRVLLVLASAESIVEVMESTIGVPDYIIDVCFAPRSAEKGAGNQQLNRQGPDGGLAVTPTRAGWPRIVGPCQFASPSALASNDTEARPMALYHLDGGALKLPFGIYPARGINLTALAGRGFHSNDHRRIIDLNVILGASEPAGSIHVRKDDKDTGDVFSYTNSFINRYSYFAAHASMIKGEHFKALGYGNEYGLDLPVLQPFALSVFGAIRRYAFIDERAYRFDYGGKISVGAQVANLTLAIERGHHVGADGRLKKEVFILPGFEVTFSNSWIHFRRGPAKCCKPSAK